MSSANVRVHVAALASCCHELQGLGVANRVAPSGTSYISFQCAAEAAVDEYTPDERAHLLAVFPSLTDTLLCHHPLLCHCIGIPAHSRLTLVCVIVMAI